MAKKGPNKMREWRRIARKYNVEATAEKIKEKRDAGIPWNSVVKNQGRKHKLKARAMQLLLPKLPPVLFIKLMVNGGWIPSGQPNLTNTEQPVTI